MWDPNYDAVCVRQSTCPYLSLPDLIHFSNSTPPALHSSMGVSHKPSVLGGTFSHRNNSSAFFFFLKKKEYVMYYDIYVNLTFIVMRYYYDDCFVLQM